LKRKGKKKKKEKKEKLLKKEDRNRKRYYFVAPSPTLCSFQRSTGPTFTFLPKVSSSVLSISFPFSFFFYIYMDAGDALAANMEMWESGSGLFGLVDHGLQQRQEHGIVLRRPVGGRRPPAAGSGCVLARPLAPSDQHVSSASAT
jgi:hypothetical protein